MVEGCQARRHGVLLVGSFEAFGEASMCGAVDVFTGFDTCEECTERVGRLPRTESHCCAVVDAIWDSDRSECWERKMAHCG